MQSPLWKNIVIHRAYFLLLLVPVIHQIIFVYVPIYGVTIAFKNFKMARGIIGSSWNNFEHFKELFSDIFFYRVLRNTIRLSFLSIALGFPITIIFALLLNELMSLRFKRIVQTVSYLPHFLSWVIIAAFVYQLLSPQSGFVNVLLLKLGVIEKPINFIVMKQWFTPIYLVSSLWQSIGWGTIIYLAAISGIDVSQYESATIDGATRFQKAMYITLPGISSTITVLLILRIGRFLNVGFEQIFNLYNPMTYEVADVISTFVYRKGLMDARYDYSTAVGLFQNVIGMVLLLVTNGIAKRLNDYSIL